MQQRTLQNVTIVVYYSVMATITVTYSPNATQVPEEILDSIHQMFRKYADQRWEVQSLAVSIVKQANANNPLVVWALLQALVDSNSGSTELLDEAKRILGLVSAHWKISKSERA